MTPPITPPADALREAKRWYIDNMRANNYAFAASQEACVFRVLADYIASLSHARDDGWRLVPVEPTEAMLAATVDDRGTPRILDFSAPDERDQPFLMMRYGYRAMLAAAPAVSEAGE